ncbi:ELM1/GtrOC1 family putative glycosyltransferase [Acinetobacter terrestris]|uniref:ELM1/GtrOC1 family putative glycosyltransferase n=1 Tax=Acinetobacter terrestris TaxID=2529843 RepID=A0AAW6USM8_9GAMM|nr:ELM1/GtrOC1 family putative glycosyltransferase [Acinetobacter terrestris]MDK1684278.1 ELM1/GtrOC1 family putative glycosyltransferase [Acinetobacter terrestris]TCB43643.1 hypothetical protein E0H83_09920 [Acinetobacter terrestris]
MNKHPTLSIAVIHDQRAGHLNPSLGIVDSLEKAYTTTLQKIITPSIKKWQISLLKKLSWYPHLFDFCSAIFFKNFQSKQNIDCIICSGMPNLLYGIFVSRRLKVPLFYAGDLRKVNGQLVNCTITALPQNIQTQQVVLATPPVKKEFTQLQTNPLDLKSALLVLGGPTSEHPFQTTDYEMIISKFLKLCSDHHLTAYITNSRRTPDLASTWNTLKKNANVQLELIHDSQSKKFNELVELSSYIFVTEDSTSMLAEAIQSGRFISSIYTPNSVFEALNKKYLHEGLMSRQALNETFSLPKQRNLAKLNLSQPLIAAIQHHLDVYP